MMLSKNRVSYLLEVYSDGKATTEEEQELFNWVAGGDEQPIKKHLEKLLSSYNSAEEATDVDWEGLYQQIIRAKSAHEIEPVEPKMRWISWAAAAAILLLIGIGYYFFTATTHVEKGKNELTVVKQQKVDDIAPPNSVNAVLTLGNGQKIILDSTGNGTLAMQGAVQVVKLADGQLAYKGTSKEIQVNSLSNPRGSKVIGVILADGSKVWINAESSLKYPTAFAGKERKVEMTGEAYFEVAPNAAMPFIVNKGGTSIRVLGTHFNVNAYEDERTMNVTLLEGSVSVTAEGGRQPKVIKPGGQAQVNKNGDIELKSTVDLDEVTAWKNGLFSFRGAGIETIMRQVSRWYDVDIVFEKHVPEKFYAEVSKTTGISTLLKMLEATKAVQFKIEGKTITVMPK